MITHRSLTLELLICLITLSGACASAQESGAKDKAGRHRYSTLGDLSAIGHRDVGCKMGMGNLFTLDQQKEMGKEYSEEVESKVRLVEDPVITEYVNRIGQNLVRNSDAVVPFTIKVIDSDDVNAFALPGGYFYINSGLIRLADSEAQLAGVMAHEIAHVSACHAARQQTRGELLSMASAPILLFGGLAAYAATAEVGIPAASFRFSRGFEMQADYLGLQYMYKAGYDPSEFISMFEKLELMERKHRGSISKAFASHPPTHKRIAMCQEEISEILPVREQYVVNTSEFKVVKSRLEAARADRDHALDQKSVGPVLRKRPD